MPASFTDITPMSICMSEFASVRKFRSMKRRYFNYFKQTDIQYYAFCYICKIRTYRKCLIGACYLHNFTIINCVARHYTAYSCSWIFCIYRHQAFFSNWSHAKYNNTRQQCKNFAVYRPPKMCRNLFYLLPSLHILSEM